MNDAPRFNRQELLFGMEGQRKIAEARIGIVGLGGLGSHVAQQTAHLGVVRYLLVDPDVVTQSGLNRLVGASLADLGSRKVDISARLIKEIQSAASVTAVGEGIESDRSQQELREVDFVFGCLDNDHARLLLTDLASQTRLPYLDLASDIDAQATPPTFGGRLLFSEPGQRCLVCMDLLDQRELARATMSEEQRAEDDRLYGIDRALLDQAGPAVVSINGVVASVAVTEFMLWVTGLSEPTSLMTYRGDLRRLTVSSDQPRPSCYYCQRSAPSPREVTPLSSPAFTWLLTGHRGLLQCPKEGELLL